MKKALALVLALTMTLGMAACGTTASSAPASGSAAAGDSSTASSASTTASSASTTGTATGSMTNGLYPGTPDPESVTINITSEPPDMNSVTTTDATAIAIMRDVLEGLTSLDQENKPVPGVAESWDISEDGLVYTFHLRQDAVWSNGEPVTANDFVFAWTQLFTASTGANYATTWQTYIKGAEEALAGDAAALGVKAVDDYTFEVTLNNPCAYFLNLMAFPSFYPVNEAFWTEVGGVDGYGRDADKMLYNGPYVMSEWQHESQVTITKNDQYWDKDNKAFIPTVYMKMINDSGAALNAFQAGELDMVGLSGEQVQLLTAEGVTPGQYEDGTPAYLEYNTNGGTPSSEAVGKGLANAKVRKALTYAIDAQSYIDNVAKSSYLPADGMVPGAIGNGEYSSARGSLIDRAMPVEDIKAMFDEGLKEAGITAADFTPVITTDEGDSAYKMVAFIQNQWKEKLGIEATVQQLTFKSRLDAQTKQNYDVCVALWGPDYDDALTYLDMFLSGVGNNHTGWSNEEYDNLIMSSYSETDAAARQDILIQAETILMEEMPIGPIYFRVRDYVMADKLTGVTRTAFQDVVMHYAKLVK